MKKKRLALLCVCLLSVSACKNSSVDSESPKTEKDGEELTIMHVDAGLEGFSEYIAKAEKKLNLRIHVEECPDNADNRQARISTILSSGDHSVDIISVNDEMISEFKYRDYLVPLDELVMTEEVRQAYQQEYLEDICMADGRIYSVPYLMDIMMFWVNQELLDEAGMEGFHDYGDFREFAGKMSGKNVYAYGDAWEQTYIYNAVSQFVNLFGGNYKDWSDPRTREGIRTLKDMLEQGYASVQQMVDYYEQMEEKFMEGRYGSVFMYSGAIKIFIGAGVYGEDRIHIAPLPSFRKKATNIAAWQYVLNNASENKDAALKFLRYAASPEGSLDYAKIMKCFPARLDVLEDERLDIAGIEEARQYLKEAELHARPMCQESMTAISETGTLFQKYLLGEMAEEAYCGEAQRLIDKYYQ